MFSLNRMGHHLPPCNNRQFSTKGMEDMKLKPEYLGNHHLKFLNNFGLPQQIISSKQFVDINNSCNRRQSDSRFSPNSSCIMRNFACPKSDYVAPNHFSYCTDRSKNDNLRLSDNFEKPSSIINNFNRIQETPKANLVASKHEKMMKTCDNSSAKPKEESKTCSDRAPKKTKRDKTQPQCDRNSQNSCSKKPKKQKSFQKKSKREADRSSCNSPQKRKNSKPWHKKSLKMEIMEIDDTFGSSYSDSNLESPAINLPVAETISYQGSPVKAAQETQTAQIPNDTPTCISPKVKNFRPRLPSDCESEDSFIVFEDNSKCPGMDVSDCDPDSTDLDWSSEDGSSEEDSDDDAVEFCSTPLKKVPGCAIAVSSPSKKVRFAHGKDLCEVHPMIQWSFAYQKARKGPWEQFALDRMRFKNRVSRVEPTLTAVLQPAHRGRIYHERFLQNLN